MIVSFMIREQLTSYLIMQMDFWMFACLVSLFGTLTKTVSRSHDTSHTLILLCRSTVTQQPDFYIVSNQLWSKYGPSKPPLVVHRRVPAFTTHSRLLINLPKSELACVLSCFSVDPLVMWKAYSACIFLLVPHLWVSSGPDHWMDCYVTQWTKSTTSQKSFALFSG